MKVAQIENGEVVNVLLLSQPMLEQFRAATGFVLIPIPGDGDVIAGDLYDGEEKVFHRPAMAYDDEGTVKIISLDQLQGQVGELTVALDVLSSVASIPFVLMAQAEQIGEAAITEHAALFAEWSPSGAYRAGDIRRCGGTLYRCVQAHGGQAGWTPDKTPALWTRIGDPGEEWPAWSQPVGAHDAYGAGDKVAHNGKRWVSAAAGNVWEPGVYGWTEQE